ncbi:MAG: hypothetical protein K0R44_1426 [Thermomicrobiales bacterium]|jgi:hypothetical protein|nr:hypothetical protein [Thermomicrobiales bacterium]
MSFQTLPALPPASQPFVDANGFVTTPWREYLIQVDNRLRRIMSGVGAAGVTVASLPSASALGAGATALVTNANATTFASTVAGGGSNVVPVYSDGTNWKIG